MSDPRAALATLFSAFERHLEVSSTRRGDDDPNVIAAYEDLADAFEEYDSALYDAYSEMTPLDIYGADDDDDDSGDDVDDVDDVDDHGDEDGGSSGRYAGLQDDDDVDFEDDEEDGDDEDD